MTAPLALTRRGLWLALAAAGLWAGWFVIGLRDVWYLVALLAALVAVALVTATVLTAFGRPEVRVSVTDPTPEVGAPVSFTAAVRHRLPFALRGAIVWEADGERLTVPFAAIAKDGAAVRAEWQPDKRGPVTARIATLVFSDPLGLATRRIRGDHEISLLVLPRPLDGFSAAARSSGSDGLDESASRPRRGGSAGPPAGAIREYRSGDAPREIHWKQSARQGALLVNLSEHAGRREYAVLLSTDPDAYRSPQEFDVAVSATAALGVHWLREGHAVRLHIGTGAPELCAGESDLLRALAFARPAADGESPPEASGRFPRVVIAGTVSECLAERLHREADGGTVYVIREGAPGQALRRAPDSWREVPVPVDGSRA